MKNNEVLEFDFIELSGEIEDSLVMPQSVNNNFFC